MSILKVNRIESLQGQPIELGQASLSGSFIGDGSQITGVVSSSYSTTSSFANQVPFDNITGKPTLVSGSTQVDVTLTQKYNTLAITGSNTFTGNQVVSGSISVTNQILSNTGSLTSPGLSVIGDTNTGIYFPSADTIGFVEGGTEVMTINSSGDVIMSGSLTVSGSLLLQRGQEKITTSATAATGTINFDALTQPVLYYTSNASNNWTLNIRGNASNTLNSIMEIGRALTVVFMVTNGATPYRQTGFTIDGSTVSPKWQGGSAPSAGNANSVDSYAVTIMKTANATFSVFESQTRFA